MVGMPLWDVRLRVLPDVKVRAGRRLERLALFVGAGRWCGLASLDAREAPTRERRTRHQARAPTVGTLFVRVPANLAGLAFIARNVRREARAKGRGHRQLYWRALGKGKLRGGGLGNYRGDLRRHAGSLADFCGGRGRRGVVLAAGALAFRLARLAGRFANEGAADAFRVLVLPVQLLLQRLSGEFVWGPEQHATSARVPALRALALFVLVCVPCQLLCARFDALRCKLWIDGFRHALSVGLAMAENHDSDTLIWSAEIAGARLEVWEKAPQREPRPALPTGADAQMAAALMDQLGAMVQRTTGQPENRYVRIHPRVDGIGSARVDNMADATVVAAALEAAGFAQRG